MSFALALQAHCLEWCLSRFGKELFRCYLYSIYLLIKCSSYNYILNKARSMEMYNKKTTNKASIWMMGKEKDRRKRERKKQLDNYIKC